MEVDLGVLQENPSVQEPPNNANAVANNEPQSSNRFAVYEALKNATFVGNSCFGGKADGTETLPALPNVPGLHVKNVGRLSLPITQDQAKSLKDPTVSYKINDDVYTKIWQIEAADVKIKNVEWDLSLKKLLSIVASKLGVNPAFLRADFDSMLYMERGSSIDWCSNVEQTPRDVGTLYIQPPSAFTGGLFRVSNGEEDQEGDQEGVEEVSGFASFDFGAVTGENEYKCHFLSHYNDCQYEMKRIKSGNRVLLHYSLRYLERGHQGTLPSAAVSRIQMVPLQQSLDMLPCHDRVVLIPLVKSYNHSSLRQYGLNALRPRHRKEAEAIKVAGNGWKVLMVQAEKSMSNLHSPEGVAASSVSSTIKVFYDEQGRNITKTTEWLKDIISLSPIPEATVIRIGQVEREENRRHFNAMLLTNSKMVEDNWGECKSSITKRHHLDFHDDYSYYSEEGGFYEVISSYQATFLLAYDENSEFELKCCTGYQGISEAMRTRIIPSRDCSMLDRLLTVIESKKHYEFTSDQSFDLLNMLIESDEDSDVVVSLINKTLSCSPSMEPTSNLWDSILIAIEKFGWNKFSQIVTVLLCDAERKKDLVCRTSRINLDVFLNRTKFSMALARIGNQTITAFAIQSVDGCVLDLLQTDNRRISLSDISTIEQMAKQQYPLDIDIVRIGIDFCIKHALVCGGPMILDIAALVFELHSKYPCRFDKDCLKAFAKTFSSVSKHILFNGASSTLHHLTLLQSIRAVIEYGSQEDMDTLGGTCIYSKECFLSILNVALENSVNGIKSKYFILDFMNRCFMQHTVPIERPDWKAGMDEICPLLHLRMVFDQYPSLATLVDATGRLPLHYLVSTKNASYKTLEFIMEKNAAAATTCDPVSKMYPFMIAGSMDNAAAAFKLLLTGPDIVSCGIDADDEEEEAGKKRKRSLSLE